MIILFHRKFLKADTDQTCPLKDCAYAEAVETLQQLKTMFSPVEKLSVLLDTVKKMTPVIQEQLGKDYIWNMDDFFPVFMYVVVRARILQLGSELDFIENFMEPSLYRGELGHIFTSLKVNIFRIVWQIFTNVGILHFYLSVMPFKLRMLNTKKETYFSSFLSDRKYFFNVL